MSIRVGLIGAGGIARGQHIPGFKALGDSVELVAVADTNGERAAAVAKEHGFARSYADHMEMLQTEKLDAVSICTPNKFHAPAAIAAMRAGANVLCEKPPARNATEAAEMAAVAREMGKILMYMFNNRFRPESLMAKRFVASGDIGSVYAARARWLRRRGIPGWGVFTSKELQGGGPLIDIGVHVLDLALHLMGYPEPELVVGSTYNHLGSKPGVPAGAGKWNWDNFEVEDMALAMIKFKNGATVMLESSFMEHMEPMEEMQVTLSGTEGGMSLYPFKLFKDLNGTLMNAAPAWIPKGVGHATGIANFVAAIRGEEEPAVTPEEGIKLQKILDAIYESAQSGRAIHL